MGLAVRLSSYSQGEKISGIKRGKKKTKKFPGLPLKMVLPIREIYLPFSAKKEKFPFLPRSSRTEKYVFHFPQKKKNFRSCRGHPEQRNMSSIFRKKRDISVFGVNGTSFLQVIQMKQRNQNVKKKKKSGKKKGRKNKKTKKCPALLRLL